ncbi:hypothetical protein C8R45DRAFT_1094072 [Mycena sanguinolenta]|nr:hypothetical protein C8R45DRAFT_1094072 [Mycena sanguinolenta]
MEKRLRELPKDADATTMRTMLKTLLDLSCDYDAVERVSYQHPFCTKLASLNTPTLRFFVSLARGLTSADIDTVVADGVLELSPPDDPTPLVGSLTYLRVAKTEKGLSAAADYLLANPSDAPYAMARLADLGASFEDIKHLMKDIFERLGHTEAIDLLFQRWGEADLSIPSPVVDNRIWLYGGTSADKQPSGRLSDDQDAARNNELPTRFGRWLNVNDEECNWACYRITALCFPDSPGIRTDPVASVSEQFVIGVQGLRCLNASVGGFFQRFQPSAELQLVLSPIPPPTYGTHLVANAPLVSKYYEAERRHVGHERIVDGAFASAVKNVASVVRSNGDAVPYLRIMKDNTAEDLASNDKAPWQANTGKGLNLFRHLLRLLHPVIPEHGDLSTAIIAAAIGPSIDFYRFFCCTFWFWLHALGTSCILLALRPVIISCHSNAVYTALGQGYLRLVWNSIPVDIQNELLAGRIPSNIDSYLPQPHENPLWHPLTVDASYLDGIGQLFICRYGPGDCDLALMIPNLDPGVSKYRSKESKLVETIITLVCALDNLALSHLQGLHDEGARVPRDDSAALRAFLEDLRSRVNNDPLATPLRAELGKAKAAYRLHSETARHLEHARRPARATVVPLSRADPYEIPGITRASGPADREEQFAFFVSYLQDLISGGFSDRAFSLIPFPFRQNFPSPEFKTWFLRLKPGTRISSSSRTLGNTPEANANALRSRDALATNIDAQQKGGQNSALKSKEANAARRTPEAVLQGILENTGNLIENPPKGRKTKPLGSIASADTYRWGFCDGCGGVIVAKDQSSTHTCDGTTDAIRVTDTRFPNLKRIVYPHDVLTEPDLVPLAPDHAEFLTRIDLASIFACPTNRAIAGKVLPAATLDQTLDSLTGYIWVDKDSVDDTEVQNATLHVAMALDRCAASLSQCPEHVLPLTASDRNRAWANECDDWLDQNHSLMRCAYGYFGILVLKADDYLDHSCDGTKFTRPIDSCTSQRYRGTRSKNGNNDCRTQRSHAVKTIFDLPPDHIKRFIYTTLIVPEQPEPPPSVPRGPRNAGGKKGKEKESAED